MNEPLANAHDVALQAAESLLAALIALECARRDRALDLLAVDALVTYAFEAAAEAPDTLTERATKAMIAIAKLATPSSIA